ncbi:MAG: HEAT repeat domain-containing protein [Desulfuromonadaceae bacterium]|nr:HEAT repeat domain-containing protein [Desulfuromonadaceae bacterium]
MDFYRPPTTHGTLDALGSIYRAVRAWKFYPKGHPTRRMSLSQAHATMLQLLDGNTLLLCCGRTGLSFPDGEHLKDPFGMTTALAFELFVRRVQKITFSPDLFLEDLLELVKILCLPPEAIQQYGGFDTMMDARGVRSIWVNEFDLAAIRIKRQKIEQAGVIPQGIDEAETGDAPPPVVAQLSPQPDSPSPEQMLQGLLGRLATCADDDIYLRLIREAVSCADNLQARHEALLLFPLIELLAGHAGDETRSRLMQEGATFAIEQIIATGELLQTVLERIELEDGVSDKALHTLLKAGGTAAITSAIELMGRSNSLRVRKILSTTLGNLGETAVPVLLDLIHDPRWFITRNICAILGSIASGEALTALAESLHHLDLRVRKEAIRSLAQLGGDEAEGAIIDILRSTDRALYPQAIASLGGMKSRKSLAELMKIVFSRDLFLQSLPLKIDALAAIALIGERQVTPHLITFLEARYFLAATRGKRLKASIAACLGKLGDVRALPPLKKLAASGGEVGSACADAVALIEKAEGRADGIS